MCCVSLWGVVRPLVKHPSCFHIMFIVTLAGRWPSHFRKDETKKDESKV